MTAKHDASTLFLLTNAHVFLRMQRFIGKMAADAKKEDAPSVTYRDALRHLERTYPDVPPKERQLYQSLLYQYFGTPAGTDGDTKLALPVVAPVPVRATRAELRFLRRLLEEPSLGFLLDDALREKLLRALDAAGIPKGGDDAFFQTNAVRPEDADGAPGATLRALWTALTQQKKLTYACRDAGGKVHQQATAVAPVRLQYDVVSGRFRLIVWDAQKEQAVWRDVRRLERVRVTDKPFDAEAIRAAFDAFLRRERRRVRLTLRDLPEKNALVRFYARFERYDKTAVMRADGTYDVVIDYYTFDEHDIVAGILSLGPCLLVEGPARLRAAVIDRLSEALAHQAPLDA